MKPLAGTRVVDFGHVWAGPFCGQILGDLGAEVIRVESHGRLDVHRRAGPYAGAPGIDTSTVWNAQNRGKLSCTLNLKDPRGVELATALVSRSQIVIENFKPRTLDRLGLGFERLRDAAPEIVLISLSGYGQDGPWITYPAYGPMMDAVGGIAHALRNEGNPQSMNGWFPDTSAALYGALAALMGLRQAHATGEGVHYDISELESTVSLLPELMLLASVGWQGSTDPATVHSNVTGSDDFACVLPAAGTDTWLALRIDNVTQLQTTAEVLGLSADAVTRIGNCTPAEIYNERQQESLENRACPGDRRLRPRPAVHSVAGKGDRSGSSSLGTRSGRRRTPQGARRIRHRTAPGSRTVQELLAGDRTTAGWTVRTESSPDAR